MSSYVEEWVDGKLVSIELLDPNKETQVEQDQDGVIDVLAYAELARRAAYEAVLAAGALSMARIREADRAGSDAFIAALGEQ